MASRKPRCSRYWRAEDLRVDGGGIQDGRDRVGLARPLERGRVQQVPQEVQGDVVEHDGQDDLVGAGPGFEQADQAAPEGAAHDAGHQDQQQVQSQRQVQGETDPGGKDAGHDDLALGTDVEQACPEGQGDAQARGDQRGGDGEGFHQRGELHGHAGPRGLKTEPWNRAT